MWTPAMLCRAVSDEVRSIRSDCCPSVTMYDPRSVLHRVDPTHDTEAIYISKSVTVRPASKVFRQGLHICALSTKFLAVCVYLSTCPCALNAFPLLNSPLSVPVHLVMCQVPGWLSGFHQSCLGDCDHLWQKKWPT